MKVKFREGVCERLIVGIFVLEGWGYLGEDVI